MPCSSYISCRVHPTSLPFVLFLLSLLYFLKCLTIYAYALFHSIRYIKNYFLEWKSVVLIISRRYKFKGGRVCALRILNCSANLVKYHMSKLIKSIIEAVRKNKVLPTLIIYVVLFYIFI